MNDFSKYLTKFFTYYLTQQRGCSQNTICSYRDTFKLFFRFLDNKGVNIKKFNLIDLNKQIVLDFLDYCEFNNSISTRNSRRAAIISFCNFVLFEEPIVMENINLILTIPIKKGNSKIVEYLLDTDMQLLLREPGLNTQKARNDTVILSVLYDTATRISEFLNIKLKDINLEKPYSITVFGKGNKIRNIPVMENTINLLKTYIKENNINNPDQFLFCNSRGEKYSRKGISHKIKKYANEVKNKSDTFPNNVHPHMFRHTKAVTMLNSGIDLLIISQFLGHSLLETTQIYAKVTDEYKRKILENAYFQTVTIEMPDWLVNNDIMSFLNTL